MKNMWKEALKLDEQRQIIGGSEDALTKAIRAGADLRIHTQFRNNEHVDTSSSSGEIIREVAEFRATCLVDNRWTAGWMTLRQPVSLPDEFGPRASMSFFMYNQNGLQAIARPFLDGGTATAEPGPGAVKPDPKMPKFHPIDAWDDGTNAPSDNFIYDFDFFRYMVRDDWQEILSHDEDGNVHSGSAEELGDAFAEGLAVKVGIRGLCRDLDEHPSRALDHEYFIETGSCYYYTDQKLFVAGTHPLVRVRAAIPMKYSTRNWDFGWFLPRTDGLVSQLIYDPYTFRSRRARSQCAIRWFVR